MGKGDAQCLELSDLGKDWPRQGLWRLRHRKCTRSRATASDRRKARNHSTSKLTCSHTLDRILQPMSVATTTTHLLQRRSLSQYSRAIFSSSARSTWIPRSTPVSSSWPGRQLSTASSTIDRMDPVFADGVDQEKLSVPLRSLIEQKQWALDEDRAGVVKTYYFKTYTKCLVCSHLSSHLSFILSTYKWILQDFTQVVGIRSKSKNHHSTITLVRLTISKPTHYTVQLWRGTILINCELEIRLRSHPLDNALPPRSHR